MALDGHSLETLARFLEQARQRYRFSSSWVPSQAKPANARLGAAALEESWAEAERVFREGEVVEGIVTGWNRGGLLVRWNKLQGFIPVSQLKQVPLFEDDESRDEELARWVGEELPLKIIELDRSRNRLVFSERATIWGPKDGERLLQEIAPGQVRRGYVSNLCDFGAFVDLGGIDGLIHISELSWGRVAHPRELLQLGQEVEVYVLNVDRENGRIGLSLKQLQPNPWKIVEAKYQVGQIVRATITNVVDFGAFAQIEEGLEGLVHISELSTSKVSHPSEVVQVGDQVLVRILRIDSEHHRLGLSMRQVSGLDQDETPLLPPAEGV
ncbi:MAG: S1 RNA-binding domain-containing protein [Anaerolineae bacterium]|nr:S1 RNA-binding domain-containing protein [Anaerolineae bacterium]